MKYSHPSSTFTVFLLPCIEHPALLFPPTYWVLLTTKRLLQISDYYNHIFSQKEYFCLTSMFILNGIQCTCPLPLPKRNIQFYCYCQVWGKVMFLHLYVILFTGRGVCPVACWDTHPPRQTPPGRHPRDTTGYGQQAGGTHPTGMHTCNFYLYHY